MKRSSRLACRFTLMRTFPSLPRVCCDAKTDRVYLELINRHVEIKRAETDH